MSRATLAKDPDAVATMFDGVARRYDVMNTLMSLGQDYRWRRIVRESLHAIPGERVLDVAAGTGASTVALARSGAFVVGCDFSVGMLSASRGRPVPLVAGDALRLPFADGSFDAVTISFGLRNVVDIDAALAEFRRVTRPGGRLLVVEFSVPTWRPFRTVYVEYLMRAIPPLARRVSSSPEAYEYLADSIREWPDQAGLADRIGAAGWESVAWRNLTGGIVALHRGTRSA
ncbi:MAG TPA: demethylmenaquinone methyltransferase [Mycobacteriales bacterium]|nr:demethylmenaquinone methyltransferase [Mycobacteriales bacterium]